MTPKDRAARIQELYATATDETAERNARTHANNELADLQAEAELQETVFSNLNSARDNDYDVSLWPVEDIIADLQAFSADLEGNTTDELRPHVEAWLTEQRGAAQ